METSIFTSIRAKIISLMLLGVAGMVIIMATNIIFDQKKTRILKLSTTVNKLVRAFLKR